MCRRAGSRFVTGQEGLDDAVDRLGADAQLLQERGRVSLGHGQKSKQQVPVPASLCPR